MAAKRSAADRAVEFFQTADLREAATILEVCRGTLARRSKAAPAAVHALEEARRRPVRRSREVTAGEVSTPEAGDAGELTKRGD